MYVGIGFNGVWCMHPIPILGYLSVSEIGVVNWNRIVIGIPNFGSLIGLIGAIGSSSLQFVFPSLFILKLSVRPAVNFVWITNTLPAIGLC